MNDEPLAPTIERTLRVVELLLANPNGLSPQDLLIQVEISRSTLFALLRTLKSLGYLDQAEKRGRYRPGPRLLAWRSASGPSAQDIFTAFSQETASAPWAETLLLLTPAQGELRIVAQMEGSQAVRCAFTTGQTLTGLKAIEQLFAAPAPADIQANGCALAAGSDTLNLALPICRDGSTPEAALLLSAPAFRWQAETLSAEFLPALRAAAARISYRLGAPCYTPYQGQNEARLQPTRPLSEEEIGIFLKGPWAARLACLRPDGRPHVIPVWQEWQDGSFYLVAWQGSQWADYLRENADCSLTVDEPWPLLRRVVVRGRAEELRQPSHLDALLQRLSLRYLGQRADPQLAGQVVGVFRIQPESLRGWQGLGRSI